MKKLVFLIVIILFQGCNSSKKTPISREEFLFGTHIGVAIYDPDKEKANENLDKVFKELKRIDKKYNSKSKDSLIWKLNEGQEIKSDDELKEILKRVEDVEKRSGGSYDITIAPLLDLWGFGSEDPKIPPKKDLEKTLEKVNYKNLEIKGEKIVLKGGSKIDTGSFIKGYAIEEVEKILRKNNIKHAYISAISSISVVGEGFNSDGSKRPWRVEVQDPKDPSKALGVLEVVDRSIGVSGDYQTYVEIDGKRYHHILDKKTGYPVDDKKMVVVVAKDSFSGDLYSTALFSMDIESGIKLLNENSDLEGLIVDANMKIHKSSGIDKYFKKY